MTRHFELTQRALLHQIKNHTISFGGNATLKIYGLLNCPSGRLMKKQNRVFFCSQEEAVDNGYRPCGHCMKDQYKKWKDDTI